MCSSLGVMSYDEVPRDAFKTPISQIVALSLITNPIEPRAFLLVEKPAIRTNSRRPSLDGHLTLIIYSSDDK